MEHLRFHHSVPDRTEMFQQPSDAVEEEDETMQIARMCGLAAHIGLAKQSTGSASTAPEASPPPEEEDDLIDIEGLIAQDEAKCKTSAWMGSFGQALTATPNHEQERELASALYSLAFALELAEAKGLDQSSSRLYTLCTQPCYWQTFNGGLENIVSFPNTMLTSFVHAFLSQAADGLRHELLPTQQQVQQRLKQFLFDGVDVRATFRRAEYRDQSSSAELCDNLYSLLESMGEDISFETITADLRWFTKVPREGCLVHDVALRLALPGLKLLQTLVSEDKINFCLRAEALNKMLEGAPDSLRRHLKGLLDWCWTTSSSVQINDNLTRTRCSPPTLRQFGVGDLVENYLQQSRSEQNFWKRFSTEGHLLEAAQQSGLAAFSLATWAVNTAAAQALVHRPLPLKNTLVRQIQDTWLNRFYNPSMGPPLAEAALDDGTLERYTGYRRVPDRVQKRSSPFAFPAPVLLFALLSGDPTEEYQSHANQGERFEEETPASIQGKPAVDQTPAAAEIIGELTARLHPLTQSSCPECSGDFTEAYLTRIMMYLFSDVAPAQNGSEAVATLMTAYTRARRLLTERAVILP